MRTEAAKEPLCFWAREIQQNECVVQHMHGKLRGSKASLVFCLQKFPDPSKNSAWAASNQLSSLLPVQYVYIGLLQQDHLTGPDNSSFIILGSWFVRTVYRNVVEYQNK